MDGVAVVVLIVVVESEMSTIVAEGAARVSVTTKVETLVLHIRLMR